VQPKHRTRLDYNQRFEALTLKPRASIIVVFPYLVACQGTSGTTNRRTDEWVPDRGSDKCATTSSESGTDPGIRAAGQKSCNQKE
jgi:hypothetical protein